MPKVCKVEIPGEPGEIHEFVARVGVSQAGEIVEQRLRQKAVGPEFLQATTALALRQGRPALPHDQRQVGVTGWLHPQSLQQQELSRGIRQMVLATQHMGDVHERIVDCVAEEKCWTAIGAADDEVADVAMGEGLASADQVYEHRLPVFRHTETQCRLQSLGEACIDLCQSELCARPEIPRRLAGGDLCLARDLKFGGSAKAGISQFLQSELTEILIVDSAAFRLAIGSADPAQIRAFLPAQPQPGQVLTQAVLEGPVRTARVGILDAQHELAVIPRGQERAEQGRACVADVYVARGAGSEAGAGAHRPGILSGAPLTSLGPGIIRYHGASPVWSPPCVQRYQASWSRPSPYSSWHRHNPSPRSRRLRPHNRPRPPSRQPLLRQPPRPLPPLRPNRSWTRATAW